MKVKSKQEAVNAPSDEEVKALLNRYDVATRKARERANRVAHACERAVDLQARRWSATRIAETVRAELRVSPATLRRALAQVSGYPRALWTALLTPAWRGQQHDYAECDPQFIPDIIAEWGTTSRRSFASAYRETRLRYEVGGRKTLPERTARARVKKLVPRNVEVFMREGESAAERTYAHQQRDYATLAVNEFWQMDGRKLDLMILLPDGRVRRMILLTCIELRTTMITGWVLVEAEHTDAFRDAFIRSVTTLGRVIPRAVSLDNTRAAAGKELSGGQKSRFRFKILQDEVCGLFTELGIDVQFVTPYHGQSKRIERVQGTLTNEIDKRAEFVGAYVGSRPDLKPENFDARKAVPLARLLEVIPEQLRLYNQRPNRSLDGASPAQLYQQLVAVHPQRTVTAEQIRLFGLARMSVKLRKPDHSIWILKNRYWTEPLTKLDPNHTGYFAKYDATDAQVPVRLYKDGRYLMDVPLLNATGYRDRDEAREHARNRRTYMKSTKAAAAALKGMVQTGPAFLPAMKADELGAPGPARAKVVELVHPRLVESAPPTDPRHQPEDLELAQDAIKLINAARLRRMKS